MRYFDKIYIINLSWHKKRRETISAELDSVGWYNYEFIDAISGVDLPSTSEMVKSGTISNLFRDANGILTKNIFACAMSHRKAQQKFLDDGLNTCLIIEDDAKFMPVALKMMLAGGMDQLHGELHSKPWDIFMWGMPHTFMPNWGLADGCNLLYEFKRMAPEWAGHAYQTTRKGAQKLVECNTPIQFAADCNIELSDTEIYCPAFSLISQTIGDFNRNIANELMTDFGTKMLHGDSEEYLPSTINTVSVQKNTNEYYETKDKSITFNNRIRQVEISGDIELEKVEWNDFITPHGDKAVNWPHIYLKG